MPFEAERRFVSAPLEATADDGGVRRIAGYAALFNVLSDDLGGFREKIVPGCFAGACEKNDVRALWNHDSNYVLGRTTNGTLVLKEDSRGLHVTCFPPDTQWAKDAMVSIGRGDVNQMSFGFRTLDDAWTTERGKGVRMLINVMLFDVSPVTFPAYPDTRVAVRSMARWEEEMRSVTSQCFNNKIDMLRRKLKLKYRSIGS